MITQKTFTKPDRYILCPACNKDENVVSHLPIGTKTAWYCDKCGAHFRLHVLPDNEVECEVIPDDSYVRRLVTLRSSGPVTIKLDTFSMLRNPHSDVPDSDEVYYAKYYYDEHTCPTNFTDRIVKVIDETGDEDPHGVFQFVSIEAWPMGYGDD